VRVCVRVCVRACVCVCVYLFVYLLRGWVYVLDKRSARAKGREGGRERTRIQRIRHLRR